MLIHYLQHHGELRHYVERTREARLPYQRGRTRDSFSSAQEGGRINIAKAETEPSVPSSLPAPAFSCSHVNKGCTGFGKIVGPGCVNAAGKARLQWKARAGTKLTIPGARLLAEPCISFPPPKKHHFTVSQNFILASTDITQSQNRIGNFLRNITTTLYYVGFQDEILKS